LAIFPDEVIHQDGHIRSALAQSGHLDSEYIDSVEQIGAKHSFRNLKFNVPIGSTYQPDIN
jgi:hypothetical protein